MLLVCLCAKVTTAQTLAVLTTDSLTSTSRTISGLQSVVHESHPEATIEIFRVGVDADANRRLCDSLRRLHPAVLIPVGTSATSYATTCGLNIPVVFASVLYPGISGFLDQNPNLPPISGASLDIPFEIQFRHFQKICPRIKSVGLIYSPMTEAMVAPAVQSAKSLGIDLEAVKIDGERDLPRALESLLSHCGALWSLADPVVFSPQGTKFILLQTMKRNIPVMGFSRTVVESGALFALDFDYKAIGRQAGAIVDKLLDGKQSSGREVTVPDIIWFHYNQKTSENLGITVPSELVAIAKEVYR